MDIKWNGPILASCMEETPKKIVGNNCFLCSFPLTPQARMRVFAKSSVDIAHLIECAVEIDSSVPVFVQQPVRLLQAVTSF